MNTLNARVLEVLRKHFNANEFALMSEVRNDAGFNASRSADYIAYGLYPSRGLNMHGMEQKKSRTDWLKELKNPAKADEFFKYCDYWWLLTVMDGVAKIEEIPEKWGWMCIHNGKIKIMKQAVKLEPLPPSRGFLASILKRATSKDGYILETSIEDRIKQARESGETSKNYRLERIEESNQTLNKQFMEFNKFTGMDLGNVQSWKQPNMEKVGEAVNFIQNGGVEKIIADLVKLEQTTQGILDHIIRNKEVLTKLLPEVPAE